MNKLHKNFSFQILLSVLLVVISAPVVMAQKNKDKKIEPPKPPVVNPPVVNKQPQPKLDVSTDPLHFSANDGDRDKQCVTVNTHKTGGYDVSVEYGYGSSYWCHTSNKSSGSFYVYCDNNPTTERRTATITVTHNKAPKLYKTISITQSGQEYKLTVNNKSYDFNENFSKDGGKKRFEVSTNDGYYSIDNKYNLPDWCKLNETNNEFTVECDQNYGDSRKATLTVRTAHTDPVKVTIIQSAMPPKAEIRNVKSVINDDTKTMTITCDVDVYNMKGKKVVAIAYFYDKDGKQLSSDHSHDNLCASSEFFEPQKDSDTKKNMKISIPYSYIDPTRQGCLVQYTVDIRDKSGKSIGQTTGMQQATIPLVPYIECDEDNHDFSAEDEGHLSCSVRTNIGYNNCGFSYKSDGNWLTVEKTPIGFEVDYKKNSKHERRYGEVVISYGNIVKKVTFVQSGKKRGEPWWRGLFSLGFDLMSDVNCNIRNIGSKENSEVFYSWGGGMLLRIGRVGHYGGRLFDIINVSFGARYMKYSYNYMDTKGDLGDYIVFPVNLKVLPFCSMETSCQFYLGGGYEYGMALKDAPSFMNWNAGIGITSRHVDWYIFFKQYFDTEEAGKYYFNKHYKNHFGTSLTFYISL